MSRIIAWGWAAALTVSLMAADLPAQEPGSDGPNIDFQQVIAGARAGRMGPRAPSQFQDFNVVTQGAEKIDGLFTLHKKGDHLYAEIQPQQFNQTLLVPVTIARGLAMAGVPVGDDDMVLIFKRVGDRIQLVRRNIHFKSTGSSLDKSVKQNYTDSVLMALPIIAINQMRGGAALIDFSDIFMTDFAQLGLGMVDRSRSSWFKVKGFAQQHGAGGRDHLQRRRPANGHDGRQRRRGRSSGHHVGDPLQPDENPRLRLPPSRAPMTALATS